MNVPCTLLTFLLSAMLDGPVGLPGGDGGWADGAGGDGGWANGAGGDSGRAGND